MAGKASKKPSNSETIASPLFLAFSIQYIAQSNVLNKAKKTPKGLVKLSANKSPFVAMTNAPL